MIDLHSHILPGVDDGAGDIGVSVEMARVAAADGTRAIVATPHVNDLYAGTPPLVQPGVEELNAELRAAGVDLDVLDGGEIAITQVPLLSDEELRRLCLGPQERWLLLESPYTHVSDMLENTVFDLQMRGFSVLLAHPERSASFGRKPERLAELVQRGVATSITAASLEGRFGREVRRNSFDMLEQGLVHNLASDAHGPTGRPPVLSTGLAELESVLEVDGDYAAWLTEEVPSAILAGQPLPHRDAPRRRRRGPLGLLRRR